MNGFNTPLLDNHMFPLWLDSCLSVGLNEYTNPLPLPSFTMLIEEFC